MRFLFPGELWWILDPICDASMVFDIGQGCETLNLQPTFLTSII
jgi:hypothetical protein